MVLDETVHNGTIIFFVDENTLLVKVLALYIEIAVCETPILSVSGMHLKQRSSESSVGKGSRTKGTAGAVSGTGMEAEISLYNTKSGTFITFIFLFLVGWIPYIGQAVAGFVGGRRSGSVGRAILSSVVAMLMGLAIITAISVAIQTSCSLLNTTIEKQIADFGITYPVLAQISSGLLDYFYLLLGSNGTFELNLAMYIVVVPFSILGGVVAGQNQKEIRLITSHVSKQSQRTIRSIDCYKAGKKMGFESYTEYTAMSVNSLNPVSHTPQGTAFAQIKESPVVTSTVNASKVTSAIPTSTSNDSFRTQSTNPIYTNDSPFGGILHVTTNRPSTTESSNDGHSDGMDFI